MEIGFSTGCLFHQKFDVIKSVCKYADCDIDNIELSFLDKRELEDFSIDPSLKSTLMKFRNISIHAPCIKISYDNDYATRSVLNRINHITETLNVKTVVFHPDVIKDFDVLESYSFCKSLENMDIRKKKGYSIDDLKDYSHIENMKFVFDIQHAYEHDGLDVYSENILGLMKDRLSHLHVSGSNEHSIHCLLHCSSNKDKIGRFMKKNKLLDIPIIFEGGISSDIDGDIRKELDYINKLADV